MSNETVLIYQVRDVLEAMGAHAREGFMSTPEHVKKLLLETAIEQLLEDPNARFVNTNFVDDFTKQQLDVMSKLGNVLKPVLHQLQRDKIEELRRNHHRMYVSSCGIDNVGGQYGIKVEELSV